MRWQYWSDEGRRALGFDSILVTFGGGDRTPVEKEGPAVKPAAVADEEELGTGMRLEASLPGSFGDRRGG